MKNKIILSIFLLVVLIANFSFASYENVTMSVVEEPVCTINISENSKFEKKLISKDLENKEVTLQLQINNNEGSTKPTGEVMLVIDNSSSMEDPASGTTTRKSLVLNSVKTLITNLLKDNTKLKIGIVSFSTNIDASKEGTIEDANLVSALSNDVTSLTKAVSNIEATGVRTDLDAGITLANQNFSSGNNSKYMIVLTDGVPNVAIDFKDSYFSDDVISKTKSKLQSISKSGINIITMLTGINNEDSIVSSVNASKQRTYKQYIEEVFGTKSNPTAGTFYYIKDDAIEKTITEDIYKSLLPVSKYYKNITIVDYFPKEIIDNFNFEYVGTPNIGTVSAKVDSTNNSITWKIEVLNPEETATVKYKLKLKENYSSAIVDKILDTNEKVDITYTDFEDKEQSKTSDVTPKLKLVEPPAALPKAGSPIILSFVLVSVRNLRFLFSKIFIFN